jgi:hypothetical protein
MEFSKLFPIISNYRPFQLTDHLKLNRRGISRDIFAIFLVVLFQTREACRNATRVLFFCHASTYERRDFFYNPTVPCEARCTPAC